MNEPDRLYQLLPAVYRERDEAEGHPLRALMRLIGGQADLVQADIQQLWDNFFIETCDRWSVPYIGDLVSNNLLHDAHRIPTPDTAHTLFPDLVGRDLRPPIAIRTRADVAKTIYYRRRKGTLPMLEELARDVTGWPAHAVEFFELLGWTQFVRNHLRMHSLHTPDIRRIEPMDRLNGPFDTISHTVDVRPIESLTGWYNIKNIGFFFWRLMSYLLDHVAARQAGDSWQYHFSPLGNPAPLFSRLRREGDEAGLATELHVPGPIRPAAFYEDLQRHQAHPLPRPDHTDFYGSTDSLVIIRDGDSVEPDRIMCKDLEFWSRPPAGFRGVISGNLSPFPDLTAVSPEMNVTIGDEGPHPATLSTAPATPATLEEARTLLEAAIRAAHTSLAFRGTWVVVVGEQLLVIPGTLGDEVVFGPSVDATTVVELGLDAGSVQGVEGVLSGRLHPFPRLTATSPQVMVTIGGVDPRLAVLSAVPTTLQEARALLEAAIQGADPAPTFTGAQVIALSDRLLVIPGTLGDPVAFDRSVDDATTAAELKLLNQVGVDPKRGRIAFALHEEPTQTVDVSYHYGFSANLGSGPYERGKWLVRPELATLRLRVKEDGIVPSGAPPVTHTNLSGPTGALSAWETAGRPNTIITIMDSRSYALPDSIQLSNERWLVIEAANGARPVLQTHEAGALAVEVLPPGNPGDSARQGELTLSGVVVEGFVHVTGDLGRLRLFHATLIPGRRLSADDGKPVTSEPSLIVEGDAGGATINAKLRVQIAFSITGPIRLPEHADGLWLLDSIVDGIGGQALSATGGIDQPGPPVTLERVTVFGASHIKKLPLASDVIFTEPVAAAQRQEGCVRFSFVPHGSQTPRRYRCQPDLEITSQIEVAQKAAQANNTTLTPAEKDAIREEIRGWLVPSFTSAMYGEPAYTQLHLSCPRQIQTGAEDGSEMGALCHLKQPQRETNLRIRLEEYLPFGLDPGIIYVT